MLPSSSGLALANGRVGVGILPVSRSPDFATTSNCSGQVLEKGKFTVFLRLIAFDLEACLLNSATHFKCFLPFI